MDEFTLDAVARKSIRGIFYLVTRTSILSVLSIVSTFILTIYLSPTNYGVFFVVSAIVVFFTYFQDIGLAAALIQKKEAPTTEELRSTFTLQQILVMAFIIPGIFFSGHIASLYKLDSTGQLLLVALLVSFLLSSLRTIPTVLLERNLDFHKLVIPQLADGFSYQICLVLFAVLGFGVNTFTIAVLVRGIVGLVATYYVRPWSIGISFKFTKIKGLINFGIPFQANSLLALVKDDLLIAYVGTVLPLAQVGYIAFAQKWAFMPLRIFMDNVIKITFPSYSRLQHDGDAMKVAVEKSLFLLTFFIFPIAVATILYSPYLVELIPTYSKWTPAILSLMFFAMSTIFSSVSTPLTNLFNAIGKVKVTLYLMVMWTVLTWVLTPVLIGMYGYIGFALASFLISLTSVVVVIVARKFVKFSFINPVIRQLVAALVMGFVIFISQGIISSLPMLFVSIAFASIAYLAVMLVLAKDDLFKTVNFVLSSIRSK